MLAALAANGETIITEPVATRDHTERLLAYMGAAVVVDHGSDNVRRIHVTGQKSLAAQSIFVASDPSSAAFVTVAALITPDSDVMMPGVMINPLRAGLYTTLKEMGGDIAFDNVRERSGEPVADIRVRSSVLKGVTVPVERVAAMIDEFPVFCVAAACADGMTTMTGLGELRVKESDRLDVMLKNLQACGVNVQSSGDDLSITGGGHVTGGVTVDSRGDHRIAMSFSIAGLRTSGEITIHGTETVATSFPTFTELANAAGLDLQVVDQ